MSHMPIAWCLHKYLQFSELNWTCMGMLHGSNCQLEEIGQVEFSVTGNDANF